MTVTIPAWAFWCLPAAIGCALMIWGGDESSPGSAMFPNIIPTAREGLGCLLVIGSFFAAIGYALARHL